MLPALYAMAGLGVAAIAGGAAPSGASPRAGAFVAVTVASAVVWGLGFVHGVYGHTNTRIEASLDRRARAGGQRAVVPGVGRRAAAAPAGLDVDEFGRAAQHGRPRRRGQGRDGRRAARRIDYVVESSPVLEHGRRGCRSGSRRRSTSSRGSTPVHSASSASPRSSAASRSGRGLLETSADEAFSVYDHPEVRIWQKVRDVDRDIVVVLDPIAAANAVAVWTNAHANGLILSDDEIAANRADRPTTRRSTPTGRSAPRVGWFVLLEVLGSPRSLLFVPLLQRLPDAGLGVAKILALDARHHAVRRRRVVASAARSAARQWLTVVRSFVGCRRGCAGAAAISSSSLARTAHRPGHRRAAGRACSWRCVVLRG